MYIYKYIYVYILYICIYMYIYMYIYMHTFSEQLLVFSDCSESIFLSEVLILGIRLFLDGVRVFGVIWDLDIIHDLCESRFL